MILLACLHVRCTPMGRDVSAGELTKPNRPPLMGDWTAPDRCWAGRRPSRQSQSQHTAVKPGARKRGGLILPASRRVPRAFTLGPRHVRRSKRNRLGCHAPTTRVWGRPCTTSQQATGPRRGRAEAAPSRPQQMTLHDVMPRQCPRRPTTLLCAPSARRPGRRGRGGVG